MPLLHIVLNHFFPSGPRGEPVVAPHVESRGQKASKRQKQQWGRGPQQSGVRASGGGGHRRFCAAALLQSTASTGSHEADVIWAAKPGLPLAGIHDVLQDTTMLAVHAPTFVANGVPQRNVIAPRRLPVVGGLGEVSPGTELSPIALRGVITDLNEPRPLHPFEGILEAKLDTLAAADDSGGQGVIGWGQATVFFLPDLFDDYSTGAVHDAAAEASPSDQTFEENSGVPLENRQSLQNETENYYGLRF